MTDAAVSMRTLYCRDNIEALSGIPSGSIDLIYLDPPFFSNHVYEVIWGDEAEVRSFKDRWEGGINHYCDWMRKRLELLYDALKPTGSLYLHCDPHASHYLKVVLDEIFGYENYRSEIIWRRTGSKGLATSRLPNNHDTILYYAKSRKFTWNHDAIYRPYDVDDLDAKTLEKYSQIDAHGRRYQLTSLVAPNPDRPNLDYEFMGVRRVWRWTQERMNEAYEAGLIFQTAPGRVPRYVRYLDEQRGKPLDSVWTDIAPLNSRAAERLGYPTQKPESLLARIIRMSTDTGDTVLDPFCGCGTTVSAAERLGRRWIGMDISPTAVNIILDRMSRMMNSNDIHVEGMPETVQQLRELKPFEFQNWVVRKFVGVHSPRKSGDMGIDGYSFFERNPIQVKRSDHVGRNVIDNFETAMRRGGHSIGYVVGFSFTRGAREEVARARWHDGLEIRLRTVADLLKPQLRGRVPELGRVEELPLAPSRTPDARPSPDELFESDQTAVIAG